MSAPGPQRVAAIDCGTNSLRLLVADLDPERHVLTDLVRRMEIVRLGQGVDAAGRLAPEALARTFGMLEEYAKIIGDSGATAVRIVATSATRDASNADEFATGVRRILGVQPEVVSGGQEAQLSYYGATTELATVASPVGESVLVAAPATGPQPPFLVVDIGGGSSEYVTPTADGQPELAAISVDIGCVRLTERHLHDDPPGADQIASAVANIDAALAEVAAAIPVASARSLVGLAGSVTTLTGLALNLPEYDSVKIHHARVSAARVHEVTAGLLAMDHAQRSAIGPIHPGRVDVIAAGALILDRTMSCFGFAEMTASEHDILDGIAWSIVTGAAQAAPATGQS